jgi:putative ABC transport system permease protein
MSTRRGPRFGTPWLLWRQFAAGIRASLVMVVLVFLAAALGTGMPRAVQALFTAAIQHQVAALVIPQGDLVSNEVGIPEPGPSAEHTTLPPEIDAVWGHFDDVIVALHASMPQPLRSSVGTAQYTLIADPAPAKPADPSLGKPQTEISLGFDPLMSERIRFVTGDAPTPVAEGVPAGTPVDIALSSASAKRMDWAIGETRYLTPRFLPSLPIRLSGIFEARDENAPYWQHTLSTLRPAIVDKGLGLPIVIGVAYADPTSWTRLASSLPLNRMNLWFPLIGASLDASTAPALAAEMRGFSSTAHPLTTGSGSGTGQPSEPPAWQPGGQSSSGPITALSFNSRLPASLDTAFMANSATSTVLAMMAAGPIGVLLVVIALGARLIVNRRWQSLVIASARGATAAQLRWTLGMEGLVLGLPAAACGALLGILLTAGATGTVDPAGLIPAALIGLVPAILLGFWASGDRAMRQRSDVELRPSGRFRWIAEPAIVVLAAVSVTVLFQRDPASSAATGIDPILVATPLLLALTACIVVLRLYPLPLARLSQRLHRSRTLSNFLGAARAFRDPAAGLAPILAIVVGVSITVFSGAMLATLHSGIETAARAAVGSDLLVTAPTITNPQLSRIRAIPGIATAAPVYAELWSTITVDGVLENASILVIDSREMAAVQSGVPGAIDFPRQLARTGGEKIPVLVSTELAQSIRPGGTLDVSYQAAKMVGTAAGTTPLSTRTDWVIVDRANAKNLVDAASPPSLFLADLKPSADPDAVKAEIRTILGAGSEVRTPADEAARLNANPSVSGLQAALLAAILIAGILCAIALAMTLALGTAARDRTLAILHTLGLSTRQARALLGWEIGPVAVVSIVVGSLLGVGLPLVVLAGVDLRPFTGGTEQPALAIDPWLMSLILGGFLVVLLLVMIITLAIARRISTAGAIRTAEEG